MAMSTGRPSRELPPLTRPSRDAERPLHEDDFEEISLVDVARVLHKRRLVLAVVVALALVAGGALTVFTTPEYEAKGTIIPLEHGGIIQNWLNSRQAASYALGAVGERVYPAIYPDSWDATSGTWKGVAPSDAQLAMKLREHVTVSGASGRETTLGVTVTLTDAALARDVADAYMQSLDALRPELENITRAELFDKYYDGTNGQEAQQRAETAAKQKAYWLVFDEPSLPNAPVRPRPALNMALAGVLGVMGGVFVVFGTEWLSQFRSEFEGIRPPPK